MPSATGNTRIIYDDFSGGDYGELGGAKSPNNSFHGTNVIVTADGAICPRPGWKNRTSSTMPTGKVVGFTPTVTTSRTLMVIVANKVYTYDRDTNGAVTEIGTLDVTPTLALLPKQGTDEYYITIPTDKSYKLLPASNTIDPLSTSPGGTEIEIYGERLLVSGAAAANRIQFSEAADFDDWPAENFINIPDTWQITALREQNNHLSIFKARGKHVLTGVPGVNPTRRKTERAPSALHPGQVAPDLNDLIWFVPLFETYPAFYDGIKTSDKYSYLKELSSVRDGDTPALPLVLGTAVSSGDRSRSTVLITQGGGANKMLLFHNGVWTRHTTSVTITGMCRAGETGDFYVTDGGAVGVAGKIYCTQFNLNRPSLTTDTFSQPGDDSTTPVTASFTLPQYWAAGGTEIRVEQIIVDFEKYNTGSASTNHFEIAISAIGRPNSINDPSVVTYTWDQAGSGAGASIGDHKRDREVQGSKLALAAGYELSINNIRGLKIQQIIVDVSVHKYRPVDH